MKASKLGILSAVIAPICCVVPLLLILLGLGSLGLGAFIGRYHWFFIAAALGLIIFAWRGYFKEKKTCNLKGCQMQNKRITLIILITASLVVAIFVGLNLYTYAIQSSQLVEKKQESIETASAVIPVEGMTCFTCEVAVSSALKKIDGVITARASAKEGNVKIVYNPEKTNIGKLIKTINKTGYKANLPGGK